MTQLALKENDVASYGIFFSGSDISFLQAVADDNSIHELAQKYSVPLNDVRTRKVLLVGRFNRIASRCQHPVGAYNRPLKAPIEILRLPLEVEAEFLTSRNIEHQIVQVKDLYDKLLTQKTLRERYMSVTEGVVKQINNNLQRDEIGLPPVAEASADSPIYTFFRKKPDLLSNRQRSFLLDVKWGNITRDTAAREHGVPPTRVTYQIKNAMRMLKHTF